MDSEQQGLPPMTSYSQLGVNISASPTPGRSFASEPQSNPQNHRTYSPMPSSHNPYSQQQNSTMQKNEARYPESSQRTHPQQQDHDPIHDYLPTHPNDIGAGIHPNDSYPSHNPTRATQRFPSASEATSYPPDLDTPLSVDFTSSPIEYRSQPTSTLDDYRNSLRGYHHLQSHNLQQHQQQQQVLHDSHDHLQSELPLYRQADTMGYAVARRSSDAPDPLQHSHPQIHAQEQHLATSSSYDSVNSTSSGFSNNNPSHTNDARSLGRLPRSGPHHTRHASSSIPMSNPEPPPPHRHPNFHVHPDFEPIHPTQSLQHENFRPHHQGRNVGPLTSTAATAEPIFRSSGALKGSSADLGPRSVSGHLNIQHPSSHPRSRSTPYSPINRLLHSPSTTHSVPASTRRDSPRPTSDSGSTIGSESIPNEEAAKGDHPRFRLPGQVDGPVLSGLPKQKESRDDGTPGSASTLSSRDPVEGGSLALGKPKKKSKMHECPICKKKFPRPSGLQTHMNTHSNERPYPCGFPGCARTFGVRSNAKRHLRTHGVIPTSHGSGSTEVPYVVGFSAPMILPPHAVDAEGASGFQQAGAGRAGFSSGRASNYEHHASSRVPSFKVRWMPPSLTTRANARQLREVQDGQSSRTTGPPQSVTRKGKELWTGDEMNEDEDEEDEEDEDVGQMFEPGMEMDTEEMDDTTREDGMFSDAAAASSLSVPLQPVLLSSGSSLSGIGGSSGSGSGSGLSLTTPSMASHSSLGYSTSILPPSSATSLTSNNQPGRYSPRKPDSFQGINFGTTADFEERNSYLSASLHPYHPSQHHDKTTP